MDVRIESIRKSLIFVIIFSHSFVIRPDFLLFLALAYKNEVLALVTITLSGEMKVIFPDQVYIQAFADRTFNHDREWQDLNKNFSFTREDLKISIDRLFTELAKNNLEYHPLAFLHFRNVEVKRINQTLSEAVSGLHCQALKEYASETLDELGAIVSKQNCKKTLKNLGIFINQMKFTNKSITVYETIINYMYLWKEDIELVEICLNAVIVFATEESDLRSRFDHDFIDKLIKILKFHMDKRDIVFTLYFMLSKLYLIDSNSYRVFRTIDGFIEILLESLELYVCDEDLFALGVKLCCGFEVKGDIFFTGDYAVPFCRTVIKGLKFHFRDSHTADSALTMIYLLDEQRAKEFSRNGICEVIVNILDFHLDDIGCISSACIAIHNLNRYYLENITSFAFTGLFDSLIKVFKRYQEDIRIVALASVVISWFKGNRLLQRKFGSREMLSLMIGLVRKHKSETLIILKATWTIIYEIDSNIQLFGRLGGFECLLQVLQEHSSNYEISLIICQLIIHVPPKCLPRLISAGAQGIIERCVDNENKMFALLALFKIAH